jgi:hypothetical protein
VLPIDLFRRPLFALSTATAIFSFAVQGLAFASGIVAKACLTGQTGGAALAALCFGVAARE